MSDVEDREVFGEEQEHEEEQDKEETRNDPEEAHEELEEAHEEEELEVSEDSVSSKSEETPLPDVPAQVEEGPNLGREGAKKTVTLDEPSKGKAEEPQANIPPEGRPTQRFVFLCEGDVEKRMFVDLPVNPDVEEAKQKLAQELHVLTENFKLLVNGKKLGTGDVLSPEGGEIFIEFEMDESDGETDDHGEASSGSFEPNVKVIKVQYEGQDGVKRYVEVSVLNTAYSKPFMGGYRNKYTGMKYYNAKCQTDRIQGSRVVPGHPPQKYYSRETQTLLPLIDEGVNTWADKCTQMSNMQTYIPSITDRIITAGPYVPYDENGNTMTPLQAALILQRAWRNYLVIKKVRDFYNALAEERTLKESFKGTSLNEFRKQQLILLTKDSYPITRADFYDLYTILGNWKRKHLEKLQQNKSGFAYRAAVAELQKKETLGLLAIEEHRIKAVEENLQRQDVTFLESVARSRVRHYPKGNITIIDDLNIQRARDFKEMFASYTRTDVSKAQRIEILTEIKTCIAKFEAIDLTIDLLELLDREIDFITMGIDDKNLQVLRKRFKSLYMNLVKNPEFNPQAKYYKPSQSTVKKYAVHKCTNCNKVMYPSHMFQHLRMHRFRMCASCSYIHTTATATVNLAPYKRILNSLRSTEMEKGCRSALAFLLQPWGMFFLVNVLWDGQSIISGSSYLPGLKVTRWLPHEEWSMWNMILLTEYEAHKHERLKDPIAYYPDEFVLNVMNRNILGRMHFASVANMNKKFLERDPCGILPKDHALYTNKRAEIFLNKNNPHGFLTPGSKTFGCRSRPAKKCDAGN